jgi:hypothetical protein
MKNGTFAEYGTDKTYQPGLCFIKEGAITIPGDSPSNEEAWGVSNTGVSLCSASQSDQRENSYTGSICCIYCKNTSQPNCPDKKICKLPGDDYQQSSQCSAGRFFSQERSCPKKRDKLRYPFPTIGCGSKSSLRLTIFSFQSVTKIKLYQPQIPLMNK